MFKSVVRYPKFSSVGHSLPWRTDNGVSVCMCILGGEINPQGRRQNAIHTSISRFKEVSGHITCAGPKVNGGTKGGSVRRKGMNIFQDVYEFSPRGIYSTIGHPFHSMCKQMVVNNIRPISFRRFIVIEFRVKSSHQNLHRFVYFIFFLNFFFFVVTNVIETTREELGIRNSRQP